MEVITGSAKRSSRSVSHNDPSVGTKWPIHPHSSLVRSITRSCAQSVSGCKYEAYTVVKKTVRAHTVRTQGVESVRVLSQNESSILVVQEELDMFIEVGHVLVDSPWRKRHKRSGPRRAAPKLIQHTLGRRVQVPTLISLCTTFSEHLGSRQLPFALQPQSLHEPLLFCRRRPIDCAVMHSVEMSAPVFFAPGGFQRTSRAPTHRRHTSFH